MTQLDTGFDLAMTDRLLTTTRSVRLRLDLGREVGREVLDTCLGVALQAATGGNLQRWRWVVVRDAGKRAAIGHYYAKAFRAMLQPATAAEAVSGVADSGAERVASRDGAIAMHEKFNEDIGREQRLMTSVEFLIEHLKDVPVIIVPCVIGRVDPPATASWISSQFGSVYPAIWNLQLALRSRGLGSCITAAHLEYEREVAELLSIPYETVMQICALPVAWYTGTSFRPAARRPLSEVVFEDIFDPASMASTGW
jgi:nitroreductase